MGYMIAVIGMFYMHVSHRFGRVNFGQVPNLITKCSVSFVCFFWYAPVVNCVSRQYAHLPNLDEMSVCGVCVWKATTHEFPKNHQ